MSTAEGLQLSICIATYKRAAFIGHTLEGIVSQLDSRSELVIVDGASPDETQQIVQSIAEQHSNVRYVREQTNSGVDQDYDKAVGYATGEYCWLMTDDDLLESGAVARVLAALADRPDLVVANSQVLTADFSSVLMDRFLDLHEDVQYASGSEAFFVDVANYLSFIGGVVVKREVWQARNRSAFYGTAFVHVGVLFQSPPIGRVKVIAKPLIRIRYGNAMWTSRGFEIWMFKWPALIWGLQGYSDAAKASVCPRTPWKSIRKLVHARGIGSYSMVEFRKFVSGRAKWSDTLRAWLVALLPGAMANAVSGFYCLFVNRKARATAYDLARGRYSTWISRIAARSLNA